MKKNFKLVAVISLIAAISVIFAACGGSNGGTTKATEAQTTAAPTEIATEEATQEATEEVTTEAETVTEAAGPLTEGTVTLMDLVNVELKDGWYSEEGANQNGNKIKLENEDVKSFLANVSVEVGKIYKEGEGAEYWANTTNSNYGEKGSVATEDINGRTYYHLSGVVDDDTQNLYFTDLNDSYYLEVAIMMMTVDEGFPVFDLISFVE